MLSCLYILYLILEFWFGLIWNLILNTVHYHHISKDVIKLSLANFARASDEAPWPPVYQILQMIQIGWKILVMLRYYVPFDRNSYIIASLSRVRIPAGRIYLFFRQFTNDIVTLFA